MHVGRRRPAARYQLEAVTCSDVAFLLVSDAFASTWSAYLCFCSGYLRDWRLVLIALWFFSSSLRVVTGMADAQGLACPAQYRGGRGRFEASEPDRQMKSIRQSA